MRFNNDEERASWELAETLEGKALDAMKQAEEALDFYITGKAITRERCQLRGISASDAEIRWSNMARAKKAMADHGFFQSQATMYYNAASSQYARAHYLRAHGPGELRAHDAAELRASIGGQRRPEHDGPREH